MSDRDLQRAVDSLSDALGEYAVARVRQALELERDRTSAEIADLRDEVRSLSLAIESVSRLASFVDTISGAHSVRVKP